MCLLIETESPDAAFGAICSKVSELSDVDEGANPCVAFIGCSEARLFEPLYLDALTGMVNVHKARRLLSEAGAMTLELGNGMGAVGAAAALGFDEKFDHTYELIAYRRRESWGTPRHVDPDSVKDMEKRTYPHTFNSYDHQKRKVLIAPHGPDPVFAGVRGDTPSAVLGAFHSLKFIEPLEGYMVYVTNQHTDAHLKKRVRWKAYSSGWVEGRVLCWRIGQGGHIYVTLSAGPDRVECAFYEPTGDLRRVARRLRKGDVVRAYGGVRRATALHPMILNVEKLEVLTLAGPPGRLEEGVYISSPRANRHLTKPLPRYGKEATSPSPRVDGWLGVLRPMTAPA